jgi:hypothetical protein
MDHSGYQKLLKTWYIRVGRIFAQHGGVKRVFIGHIYAWPTLTISIAASGKL